MLYLRNVHRARVARLGEETSHTHLVVVHDVAPEVLAPDGKTPLSTWLAVREQEVVGGGALITDDYNPLEKLQVAKAEYYRSILLDRMGPILMAF